MLLYAISLAVVCLADLATAPQVPTVAQLAQVARDIYLEEDIVQICDTSNSNNSLEFAC